MALTKYLVVLYQTGGMGLNECMTDSSLCPAITVFFYAFLWRGCLLVGQTHRVLCCP